MKKTLTLLLIFLPLLMLAQQQDLEPANLEQHYKIYDVQLKKIISLEQLLIKAAEKQVIFFGEEHNDSIGHQLEKHIYKGLLEKHPQTALSMEMFSTDVQPVIEEYLAGLISEKNFIREARAWNNYTDYRPLLEQAKTAQQSVIGGNVSTRYSNAVSRSGLDALKEFPKSSQNWLPPLPIDTAEGRYYEKFLTVMDGHIGTMKIYQTQNLWDASMAWSIHSLLKKQKTAKVFQVNGRFHSDEKLGTYARLLKYRPKTTCTNISCFYSSDFQQPEWQKYVHLADYIILTDPEVKRSY